jgi:MoaA/NifB/PqqE/SkfB family radical SAM enzyme
MFSRDTYCILPWSSIQINPSGDYKICCFSGVTGENHGMAIDSDGKVMNVMTHSIKEALNSENHKQLRLSQSKNERNPLCKVCWDRDDANKNNARTTSLRFFRTFDQLPGLDNAVTLEKASGVMANDGSIDEFPISLDLRFTNVCNMKCIMCSSKYSNQWYEDEEKLYGTNFMHVDPSLKYNIIVKNGVYKSDMPVWHDSDAWWKNFDDIKHRIRHLYLTGGEPFIVKGHDVLLDKLIELNLASNIILEYDTNLSVINDKILNRLKQFKEVILSVSCDDVDEQYELIRFPGKFSNMTKNLQLLKDRDFEIRHLSTCIGIYSIFSPLRLRDKFPEYKLSLRMLRAPFHSDIMYLPKSAKEEVIRVYRESNIEDRWKNFVISYLENNMNTFPDKECVDMTKQHINYLNKLDEIRGTDWKKTFPDVVKLLERCL